MINSIIKISFSRLFIRSIWNLKIFNYQKPTNLFINHPSIMGSNLSSNNCNISPEAFTFINTVIHQNCVVIFSKTNCPYSKMAKKVFNNMGIQYHTVELNLREDGEELQNALMDLTGINTVPRIFINGSCIGGGVDTQKLYKQGKLEGLLEKCSHKNKELKSPL